jgi:superfamily II DNA or RNA helicase
MNQHGYIYIRNHPSYELYDACKLGKANNIPERDSQYATGEITRGYFELVFEVPFEKVNEIERLLQKEFKESHIYHNGGKEFYNKKINTLIEPCLINYGIEYRKLSIQEISDLTRCNRVRQTMKKLRKNVQTLIQILKSKKTNEKIAPYIPRKDQTIIIEKSIEYFEKYDKGMLVLMCGVGKTLISLWVSHRLKSNTILIGVPNKLLLKQWEYKIKETMQNFPYLIVSSKHISDIERITEFLKVHQEKCIIITTYSSSYKVNIATQNISFKFDMKINDEVHHLTSTNMKSSNTTKKYIEMLKIPSSKQLSLTATLKQIESNNKEDIIVSNDSIEHFGEIIDRKCLLWAITEKIVCDYIIQTIITNEEKLESHLVKFNIMEENDKRLFLSAYASLKSIYEGHSHHLLIYANNQDNSEKIIQYVKMLLNDNYFTIPGLYFSSYHSSMISKDQMKILDMFESSIFGIISCVYCLGEGWDFPKLDGVVFAENMTSNIRIVQSALRASRKYEKDDNKETKIILPILNREDWMDNNDNSDLKKVREVIYQMSLEDEMIIQKIKVFKIDIAKHYGKTDPNPKKESVQNFGIYDEELTQKLRLKTTKRNSLAITYEKARKIITEKYIKSKESYYELCDRDIRLSKEPEIVFKGQFTNWIEYLSIERVYYDLETCKKKVNEYLSNNLIKMNDVNHLNLSTFCTKLCKIDTLFPPNGLWTDYYNIKDLCDIIIIKSKKKKIGAM